MVDLQGTLDKALMIAGNCAREYLAEDTTPAIRRMFNQGLFRALYIDPDGEVERYELTEPFATVLDPNCLPTWRKSGRWADSRLRHRRRLTIQNLKAACEPRASLLTPTSAPRKRTLRTARPSGVVCTGTLWCPRQDSNLRPRLRRAVLYPLSYGGSATRKG